MRAPNLSLSQSRHGGTARIVPSWNDANQSSWLFLVTQRLRTDCENGLAASRAFDSQSITSFQALQAPFLITDDALAEAVAASDIGTRMLESLSSAGMVGLTLWPEDLRHPFSVIPDKPIIFPEDFERSLGK